jgi:ubiquinone/menaquinone biosynthesis C-methylase UbiE
MSASAGTDAVYFMGRSAHETARLQRQAAVYDPFTRQLFVDAGITAGMRVLDVGSGAGDVALLLGDLVGPGGAVVGVDQNAAVLETARARARAAGRTNLTFVAGDVREIALPDRLDAVVGRLVLLYTHDPAAVLRRVCGRLPPGGVVAFEEPDLSQGLLAVPAAPTYAQAARWLRAAIAHAGADLQMGYKLHRAFVAAGLPAPRTHLFAPMGGGPDWVGYEYLADLIRSVAPLLVEAGFATEAELAVDELAGRLRAELVDGQGAATLVTHVGAWARTP